VQVRALQAIRDDRGRGDWKRCLGHPAAEEPGHAGRRADWASATGTHIILLPKLALSCSKISAAATSAPAAVSGDRERSKTGPVHVERAYLRQFDGDA
jgi:hypothetical protein